MSTLKATRELIEMAILSDPHNRVDYGDEDVDEQTQILLVIDAMNDKGFRPITVDEYLQEKKLLERDGSTGGNITLWRPITAPVSPATDNSGGKRNASEADVKVNLSSIVVMKDKKPRNKNLSSP
jgi:hypothetical protein